MLEWFARSLTIRKGAARDWFGEGRNTWQVTGQTISLSAVMGLQSDYQWGSTNSGAI